MQSTIASQASCSGRASSWLHNTSSAVPSNIMHRRSRCSLPSCFTRRTRYRTRHASPKASAAAQPGSSPSGLQLASSVMDILCLLASVLLLGRSIQQYQRAHQAAVDTAQQGTKRQIAGLHHMQTASCQQQALLDPLLCIGPSAFLCMLAISSMVFKASQSR